MKDKIKYLIALSQIKGIGFRRAHQIIESFGSAKQFIETCQTDRKKIPGILRENCDASSIRNVLTYAEEQMAHCEKYKVDILAYDGPNYPHRLREIGDCPLVLYGKGEMNLNVNYVIGIVGTRRMTRYGKEIIEDFIRDLKGYDVLIVSGLAYGVDTQVHQSCVENQMPTVGVMGTGVDQIYPAVNRTLAKKMLQRGGVLTEYGVGTPPDAFNFPTRNRIIAGMSDVLIVVESAEKGGAMITANLAFDYNKEVFAFPGRITDTRSKGTHLLIKSNKAQLIESADDMIRMMGWDTANQPKYKQPSLFEELNEMEKAIIDAFEDREHFHIDQVLTQLSYSNAEAASVLLQMELKGLLRSLPGHRYRIN